MGLNFLQHLFYKMVISKAFTFSESLKFLHCVHCFFKFFPTALPIVCIYHKLFVDLENYWEKQKFLYTA